MAQTMSSTFPGRDTSSTFGRNSYIFPSPPGSSGSFTSRQRRHTASEGSHFALDTSRSASNLISQASKYQLRDYDETFMTDNLQDRHRRDDIAALIDFLRNQAPPPSNIMSSEQSGIRDDDDDDERGRWTTKLKRASRRSKSMPRRAQQIQLPDSAVSGKTIGGHRHIAISIPFEASPIGDTARSQYPVIPNQDGRSESRPGSSRSSPVRTFTNDKGVVTVLRTVTEDNEGTSSPSRASSYSYTPFPSASRLSGRSARRSVSPSASSLGSAKGKYVDYYASRASDADSLRHSRSSSIEQRSGAHTPTQSRMFQRSAYPARASSMVPHRVVRQDASIDGVISQESIKLGLPPSPVGSYRRSIAESIASQGEDAVIGEAQPAFPVKSTSIVFNHNYSNSRNKSISKSFSNLKRNSDSESNIDAKERLRPEPLAPPKHVGVPFPDSPLLPPNFDSPPTPASVNNRSRREIVRDRKKRDIEAMRNAKKQRMEAVQSAQDRNEATETGHDATAQTWNNEAQSGNVIDGHGDGRGNADTSLQDAHKSGSSRNRPLSEPAQTANANVQPPAVTVTPVASGPTLVPIMVVADLEPFEDTAEPKEATDRHKTRNSLVTGHRSQPSGSRSLHDISGYPSPPMSSSGSPPQRHDSLDRTSLSRRREWNASREHEKKARDAAVRDSCSRDTSTPANRRSQSRMSTDGILGSESKFTDTDKEILRLYEAYRDQRFREMERRVRRLERNGDVWLRSLVPVLNSVNRNMTPNHDDQDVTMNRASSEWISDEEPGNPAERRCRSAMGRPPHGSRRSSRRASLSQGRLVEQLARKKEEAEPWMNSQGSPSGGEDDMSGLGTIEPLMRELAGEASRRRRAAERLGVSEDAKGCRTL